MTTAAILTFPSRRFPGDIFVDIHSHLIHFHQGVQKYSIFKLHLKKKSCIKFAWHQRQREMERKNSKVVYIVKYKIHFDGGKWSLQAPVR